MASRTKWVSLASIEKLVEIQWRKYLEERAAYCQVPQSASADRTPRPESNCGQSLHMDQGHVATIRQPLGSPAQ
jgi:hypothetical protein